MPFARTPAVVRGGPDLAMNRHRPVMLDEAVAGLAVRGGGIYVDGTFGRGGHSAAILEQLDAQAHLHALDQDPAAVAHARARFGEIRRATRRERVFQSV